MSFFECLATRLRRCPFDQEVFDAANSALALRLHLAEHHRSDICRVETVTPSAVVDQCERPRRLCCCPTCGFAAPDPGEVSPITVLDRHIRAEHPNPFGPVQISFRVSDDETLIDHFVDRQGSTDVCVCNGFGCRKFFADQASVAEHWIEAHCDQAVTAEEAQAALETDSSRFRAALGECLTQVAEDEVRRALSTREPDDGYVIRHLPALPRIQSAPTESIIYVEGEQVRLLDRELNELLSYEGFDLENDLPGGAASTASVELRFCNIQHGYIPLVKEVRRILPVLADGELIDVCWFETPDTWLPCKVSRSKRAIYNLEKELQRIFHRFPAGVVLYMTHRNGRRFELSVKRRPHVVPDCKVFVTDPAKGWRVLRVSESVEWETTDDVFKHQLTFQEMEALQQEARATGLSIKDAVYEVMRRLSPGEELHVREVYDQVFWRLRTCSLPAVWAQFRPENVCYQRVRPGYYRFDADKPSPPTIRRVLPRASGRERLPVAREQGHYIVRQRHPTAWRFNVFRSRFEEELDNNPDALLDVRCAFGTSREVGFLIPISYLTEVVIPRAHSHEGGRYMFTVNPYDYTFVWDYRVEMSGKPYLNGQ